MTTEHIELWRQDIRGGSPLFCEIDHRSGRAKIYRADGTAQWIGGAGAGEVSEFKARAEQIATTPHH